MQDADYFDREAPGLLVSGVGPIRSRSEDRTYLIIPAAWLTGFLDAYPPVDAPPADPVACFPALALRDEEGRVVKRLVGSFCPHGRVYPVREG